jgi:hypothetical protein
MAGNHGGARAGAGRKPGARWFSQRIKDTSVARLAELAAGGRDPLELLIHMAFDRSLEPALRVTAATNAVPFLHPRLSSAQVETRSTSLHAQVDPEQLVASLQERIERVRQPALEAPPEPPAAEPAL